MGVIEDGSISGRIPSSEAFVIHYPAYPSSISRAVDTLGGDDAVTKARNSKSKELELRFRPEDPYSHPTFGRLYHCNNLLLRICRKPSGNNPKEDRHTDKPNHYEDSSSKSGEPSSIQEFTTSNDDMQICLTADVIARVKESYEFKGMADYQHILPSQGDVIHRKKKRRTIAEGPKEKEDLAPVSNEEIMALLPLLFSPKDLPQTVALRPSPMLSSMKKQEAVVTHRWEMEIESSIAIGFDIKDILIDD
ncbi:hypothetical protein Droror1_Dr00001166 [Drosera rotundifolia]